MKSHTATWKFLFLVAVVFIILALNAIASEMREFLVQFSSPLQRVFWKAGSNGSDFLSGMFQASFLKEQNQQLLESNFALLQKLIELEERAQENQELREALNLGLQKDFQLIAGEVIGKNIGEDILLIRREGGGKLQKGMAVITAGRVLIGKIQEEEGKIATVQLISHKDSAIDAKIQDTEIAGILKGEGAWRLSLDFIPREAKILQGGTVITSGARGVVPKNLLVGTIQQTLEEGTDPFQKAIMEPFFRIDDLDLVFVIADY